MPTTTEQLESLARRIRTGLTKSEDPTPLAQLEERIAFVVDRIDGVRQLHKEQLLAILRNECTIGTSLLRLDSYAPLTFHYRGHARTRLKEGLLKLDRERRDLRQAYEKEVARLQEILLELLGERRHVGDS